MYSILTDMKNFLLSNYPGFKVDFGYENVTAERPVIRKALYLMPTMLSESKLEYALYVYTPVKLGGDECVRTAYVVYNNLISGGFDMENAFVGAVKYDDKSQSFAVKIVGSVQSEKEPVEEAEKVNCLMTYEVFGRSFSLSFFADKYNVVCNALEYPIMTIYDSSQIDIINESKSYRLVIEGVALEEAVNTLMNHRVFELSFSNDVIVYENCKFEKYETIDSERYTVTVSASGVRQMVTE